MPDTASVASLQLHARPLAKGGFAHGTATTKSSSSSATSARAVGGAVLNALENASAGDSKWGWARARALAAASTSQLFSLSACLQSLRGRPVSVCSSRICS